MYLAAHTVYTQPAVEPVSLAEAKAHLRVDGDDENALIAQLIVAARRSCEEWARRAFITQTLDLRLEAWPSSVLELPMPPLQSVTSISYTDSNGATGTVTASDYTVYATTDPGRIVLKSGKSWPGVDLMPGPSLMVRYVAGYGGAASVPANYRQAILLLVGSMYENREAFVVGTIVSKLPFAVEMLLMTDRVSWY